MILIMAQGSQNRLGKTTPKQLLTLDGKETIIGRTLRQCRKASPERTIHVVAPPAFEDEVLRAGATLISLERPGARLIDGLVQVDEHWSVGGTILLGDVIFSNAAIRGALGERSALPIFVGRTSANRVTGRNWPELFSLTLPPIEVNPAPALKIAELAASEKPRVGLWEMYRALSGIEGIGKSSLLIDPNDYTDDIDYPDDVRVFFPVLARHALSDDQQEAAAA